jgi:hypothetical protein
MPRKYVPKYKRKSTATRYKKYPKQKFKKKSGLTRSVIPFTREKETYVRLDTLTGIDDGAGTYINMIRTNDGGIVGRIRIRLNNLPTPSDFTNLFKEYKLNYLKLTFYPAGNVAGTRVDERDGASVGNKNILIRTCLNRTNEVPDNTNSVNDWSQLQAKKQWLLVQNRPTTITMKLNQLTTIQSGDAAAYSKHVITKPKYISTNATDINHYGITLRFDSLDGTAIDAASGDIWPKFRVISKLYFTCKGVA